MSKNIVVLSDGTGQVGGKGHDTNIYKLFRMLEDRTDQQIVFYDQGLGTDGRTVSGNAFGAGFSNNLLQCYKFIFENYKAEDKLFLFGFSRGAATVRSLASFIHYFGILPMARPELIQEAYKIYANRRQPKPSQQVDTQAEDKRSLREKLEERALKLIDNAAFQVNQVLHEDLDEQAAEFTRAHPNQWVSIECLGVWDTVPALGLVPAAALNFLIDRVPSWKHQYHDFKLHPSVRNAYQALSIDDDRKWFFPSLWKEYDPNKQKMEQVWFGGAHTDVGGGFWEAGFSDLALEWMVQKTAQHGLRLFFGSRRYWNFTVAPDYTDVIHPPRIGIGRIYKRGIREAVWDREAYKLFGPPKIHESVLERAKHDRSYRPWILINYPRTVDEWFRKKYEDEMLDRYIKEMQLEYETWYMKMREDGRTNLPGPAKWIADLPVSHEKWLAKNDYSFEAWLAQNEFFFDELKGDEFKGKKILVERTKPKLPLDFELRDYDRDSLPVRLAKTYEDRFAFDNLLERSMSRKFNRDRIKYDSDRWKPRDSPKDPEG